MANLATLLTDKVNSATFITIDTETDVKLTGGKKNPFQGRVKKRVCGSNVMVFQNKNTNGYENMVRRRLEKEGKDPESFKLKPRTWGHRIKGTPFVEHKGAYYIEVIFLHPGKTEYLVDGVVTPKEQIDGLPLKKEEAKQGGLDNKVIIRTYKVSSIKGITIDKCHYDNLTFNLPHYHKVGSSSDPIFIPNQQRNEMHTIVYYASDDTLGDTTPNDRSKYRQWVYKELLREFSNHHIEVTERPSVMTCWTDDIEHEDEINDFCSRLWDRCPWDWVD